MTALNWWTLAAGLIGALLGAAGAIVAQVVSARYTAKRDSDRLEFEKQRHDSEMSAQSRALFFDSKRGAFVSALRQGEDAREIFFDVIRARLTGNHEALLPAMRDRMMSWGTEWRRATAEVTLFDESLRALMREVQDEIQDCTSSCTAKSLTTCRTSRRLQQESTSSVRGCR